MVWYQIISYFCTNLIQIILILYLITELLDFPKVNQKAAIFSLVGSGIVTALSLLHLSQYYFLGIEMLIMFVMVCFLFQENLRLCLFLIFFYETAIALWDFLISSGLGVLFQSENFTIRTTLQYMAAIWIVRLLMFGIVLFVRKNITKSKCAFQLASLIAILGLFGTIALSGQSIIPLNDDQLTTWTILSLVIMFAIMLFNLNRQYEMEREIAKLKAEQTELLERDYWSLNKSYTANAKLYHDLHNHVEIMYRYLTQGKVDDAIHYLEDLRTPIQEITQTAWTGDEAIDYLINSKLALAEQAHIVTKVNIEFPRNTNIRNADLTAILGNLLDNALEATENSNDNFRFIHLTIRRIYDMLVIKVENGSETAPVALTGGELESFKQNKQLHGWGLKSARAAAENYDGTVETSYVNNTFRAVATLSFNGLKTE